jgi:hypothetical protein
MRVYLVFFYLAAVVGCKASVNKTQLASGFQYSDAAGTDAINTENENDVDRLPPVITDPQKINRLATGLAERGVPEDLIEVVIIELTSERVSRKKFTSKFVDFNFPNPSGSTVPFFSQTPGVLNDPPIQEPEMVLDIGTTTTSEYPSKNLIFDFLSQPTRNSLAAYITRSDFNALCV